MKKRVYLIIVLVICFSINISLFMTNAYEKNDHDKLMRTILFSDYQYLSYRRVCENEDVKKAIEALENASYLTIDQFNGNGQNSLDMLKDYNVKGLPDSIEEIDYKGSGKTHRSKTHRGWDFNYVIKKDNEFWDLRKQILICTVDRIFDFEGNNKQRDAFCELIYYIHILGDHLDNETMIQSNNNGLMIDVGGRTDKDDVANKLMLLLPILFEKQRTTHVYNTLIRGLEKQNSYIKALIKTEGGINTEEKFIELQEYTKKIKDILIYNIPALLKNEKFFQNVFS